MRCCALLVCWTVFFQSQVFGLPASLTMGLNLHQCRRAQSPKNSTQGINRVTSDSWDPLYMLEIAHTGHHEYKVMVKLGNRLMPFSDALLSVETNGTCGVGDLIYDTNDFFQVEQPLDDCPLLLTTNRKSVMQHLPPLRWKSPRCGCVHFRLMVLEASTIYYAEQPSITGGPLTAVRCIGGSDPSHQKLSQEERIELLCRVVDRFNGLEINQRPDFLKRRRLEPRYLDLQVAELALSTRRVDISRCCAKTGNERKRECLNDIRRRRVDSFCEDGSPDIPFTASRSRFMRQREEACCWRLGEARYNCFSLNAYTKHGDWSADHSLDESDPLNDLGDYSEEIQDLEKEYGMSLLPMTNPESETKTTPTTATTTTSPPSISIITTTTPDRAQNPFLPVLSVVESFADNPAGREENEEGEIGGGQNKRSQLMPTARTQVDEKTFISRELGEQQGGRSVDKTFSKLQNRMLKLSLKVQCCQSGVGAAGNTYGDFRTVWSQCNHSAGKYVRTQRLRSGQKICSNQFQKCCIEMAISAPSDVVTLKPDLASSREWDRDRYLVNTVYIPPHARLQTAPDGASQQRQQELAAGTSWRTSAERTGNSQHGVSSRLLQQPANVDQPEIDGDPHNSHQRQSRKPHSSKESLEIKKIEEIEDEEGGVQIDQELFHRQQRRLKKQNSREQKKLHRSEKKPDEVTRAARLLAARREIDDAEIDEEPTLKKASRKKNDGQSRQQKNRGSKHQGKEITDPETPLQTTSTLSYVESTKASFVDSQIGSNTTKSLQPDRESVLSRRQQRLLNEKQQLDKLLAEITKEIESNEDELVAGETDMGSEEDMDTMGVKSEDSNDKDEPFENDGDDDSEVDSDYTEDEDEFETEKVQDREYDVEEGDKNEHSVQEPRERVETSGHKPQTQTLTTANNQVATEKTLDNLTLTTKNTSLKISLSTESNTEVINYERTTRQAKTLTEPKEPTSGQSNQAPFNFVRDRLLRPTKEDLSSEDGHSQQSGGRSGRRREKNQHRRKEQRKSHRQHLGGYRGLSETLEED